MAKKHKLQEVHTKINSCLAKVIYEYKRASPKTSLIAWSDSCGGQNQNIKMSLALLKLASDANLQYTLISQKFLKNDNSFCQTIVISVTLKND